MMPQPLSPDDAEELLAEAELVPALAGTIAYMKEVRDRCLDAGIPVLVGCPGGAKSCGSKTHLLVQEADIQRVASVMRDEWTSMLAREGVVTPTAGTAAAPLADGDEPPCPACGCAAALVAGACADCGLVLE